MKPKMQIDCLILAAGSSSRFGSCKLLSDWKGQPLIVNSIAAARKLNPARICVIGGAFYPALSSLIAELNTKPKKVTDSDIELLEFRAWELGIGNSLAFGVKHLQSPNPVLVMLGDQPLVSEQDLQRLYRGWSEQPEKIACASFANTLGVPAIFPAHFKARLYECRGDRGAKNVLLHYPEQVTPVAMPSAEFDIDTPVDLKTYIKKIM